MEKTQLPKESFGKKVKRLSILALAIFGGVIVIIIVLAIATGDSAKDTTLQPVITHTQENTAPLVATTSKPASASVKPVPATTPTPKPTVTPAPASQTDRANILAILKANASAKWGDNYQMVKYEYDNQVEAYDWVMAQSKYPSIMVGAEQKWGNNYQMVKYEYQNQVEAYEWINSQTAYPDIMAKAKQKWGTNYQMVKYEYENQVEAYKGL